MQLFAKDITAASAEFDKMLIKALEEVGKITPGQHREAGDLFEYERF